MSNLALGGSYTTQQTESQHDQCQFTGTVRYVSQTGNNNNSGISPDNALATINYAIAQSGPGDAIRVGYGTYNENGMDLNQNSLELWLEAGCILQNTAGSPVLTISGFGCKVIASGNVRIDVPAGAVGVIVLGGFVYIEKLRINCNSAGTYGFDIYGDGTEIIRCRCRNPTTAAYRIQSDRVKLSGCGCAGAAGDTSIGYLMTNNCECAWLQNCVSRGNETSGFYVDDGCTGGIIQDCASGRGDGRWVDIDDAFVWANFSFDDLIHSTSTFTATGGVGGVGTNYNIFQVTGAVQVFNIFGIVEIVTPATNSTINLELYSANAAVDITDAAGAPDMVSRVVGTTLARISVAADPIGLAEPDSTPAVLENANFRTPRTPIILVEDDDADTYIQVVLSAALASGAVHWQCQWEPASDDGFLTPV